ncbi:MAG: hypothetical protein ACXV2B_07530 [Halobacteriota archaeon]
MPIISTRQAQSIYLVISGAACSSCISEDDKLERSGIRASTLEDREATAQTIFGSISWIMMQRHAQARASSEGVEALVNEVRKILPGITCHHDIEKITIALKELMGNQGR